MIADRVRFGVLVQAIDPLQEFVRLVRLVENLCFEYLWIADSSLHARDVYSYLTIAALNSHRLKLGTGVTHPHTRHPAVNLNAIATLDHVSGGRAVLGIGAGDRPVLELGLRPAAVDVVREMVLISRRLLTGESVDFQGSAFRVQGARLQYPASTAQVPVYLAASGPRMLSLAGEVADGVLVQVGSDVACLRYAVDRVREAASRAGRSLADVDVSAMLYGSIRDDGRLAREDARPFAAWIPQTVPVYCEIAGIPKGDADTVRRLYSGGELHEALTAAASVTDEMIQKFTLSGTPEECRERVEAIAQSGIRHITFFPMGEDRLGSLRRFAEAILAPMAGGIPSLLAG